MILPYLRGILSFFYAPVTWIIFFINLFIMVFNLKSSYLGQIEIDKNYDDPLFLQTQGEMYVQFINYQSKNYPPEINDLVRLAVIKNDLEKYQILGGIAIRDQIFHNQIDTFNFQGDEILINWWKNSLREIKDSQSVHPSYYLGLNSSDVSLSKWITYQFVHSGAVHLIGNMLFLLIFGSVLEPIIGGAALFIVYILSGMVAAGTFLFFTGVNLVPLVGASGSVSGIMALFCMIFWKIPVRYVYFLFIPRRGYAGYVYLPAWVTLLLWIFSDLAGFFGVSHHYSGIAYSAHLGGELAGFLVGSTIFLVRKYFLKKDSMSSAFPNSLPIGTTIN
jgi:membrane associated rhomboid family serine protease